MNKLYITGRITKGIKQKIEDLLNWLEEKDKASKKEYKQLSIFDF